MEVVRASVWKPPEFRKVSDTQATTPHRKHEHNKETKRQSGHPASSMSPQAEIF